MPAKSKRPTLSRARKVVFSVVGSLLGLCVLEGIASGLAICADLWGQWTDRAEVVTLREESHCQYDEELGWINKPGITLKGFYGPGRDITINQSGLRGLEEIDPESPHYRVICLGDSFTLGYGVGDQQTIPYHLQQQLVSGTQVANMGQGGYSVGQSWLWLKRIGPDLKPDLVVCLLIPEDFRRLATVRTANGYSTPQFTVAGDRVSVSNVPVPPKLEVGTVLPRHVELLKTVQARSTLVQEITRLSSRARAEIADDEVVLQCGMMVLKSIARECRAMDCQLAVVLTPTLSDANDPTMGARYRTCSNVLADFLRGERIPYLDMLPHFIRRDIGPVFLNDDFHHYSSTGNKQVAMEVSQWLSQVYPEYRAAVVSDANSE